MPFDVVIEQIDRAYGKSWHEVFASIDPVPLGAASIAQVHKATLLDGTTVAVKVRRPGVAESMAEDIMLMKHLAGLGRVRSNFPSRHPAVARGLHRGNRAHDGQ